jgi:predicted ATPase/class 3 adenylate cyclase
MATRPSGTVTFLFTDIVGSTGRWERDRQAMAATLAQHDSFLSTAVLEAGGLVVKHTGDGMLAVFVSAAAAVVAAVDAQRRLATGPWPTDPVTVRMGLHSGEAVEAEGDYFGPTLNRAARVMAAGWGGQVLCTQATVELARDRVAEGIGFQSLGEHRLRDMSQPIALWQVTHPELADRFPPPRSLEHAVGNLPTMLSHFVGRAGEVRQLRHALADARLLTLTGVGGVGKTRLALEIAAEVEHDHPDGVWWCELAPLGDPGAVPGVVAGTFGVVPEPGRPLLDTLAAHLAPRRALLVLDNCEHLLDIAADLADNLCRRCPGLRVLTTSREPLGIDGEHTYAVRPLTGDDAVSLFVERARGVQPAFVADDATRQICARLDGIPLALEMAAARLRSMQPAEILARLDERFRLLVGGRRAAERQQTLRATVAWSHELLDDRERRVFRRLAPFAGSFTLDAAEAVTTDDDLDLIDVDDLLGGLVAKSLVVADAADGTTRYGLLETIRQFAQEQLDASGEADQRRRRHAEHYTRFVATAAQGLRDVDEPIWADRVAAELDNLRAAHNWALATGDAGLALRLFAPLPASTLDEPTAYELFTWIDPTVSLPGAAHETCVWLVLVWMFSRALQLFEWDKLAADVEWARTLAGHAERPEFHQLEAAYFNGVEGDMARAAASYASAAEGFLAAADLFHAVRSSALHLYCRSPFGIDETFDTDLDTSLALARRCGSPYMRAFGLVAFVAASPTTILDRPDRALQLLDEATPHAGRSRNPFVARIIGPARVLALGVLGKPDALDVASEQILISRNRNQVGAQAGTMSVAFSLLGHHELAAELIGATKSGRTMYHGLRASPKVLEAWERTRAALGDEAYEAAIARGAARDYDELVDWLRAALDGLRAAGRDANRAATQQLPP